MQLDVYPSKLPDTLEINTGSEKDGDVDATKLQAALSALNDVYKGLQRIQIQQKRDRHRLEIHNEANTANYNKVFTGSIIETTIFIAVSVFQVSINLCSALFICRYSLSGDGLRQELTQNLGLNVK